MDQLGEPCTMERGVRHCDPLSPDLFNVMVEVILKPDSHQRLKCCKLSLLASVNDKMLFAATKTPAMSNKS